MIFDFLIEYMVFPAMSIKGRRGEIITVETSYTIY
jgi:hypothetical protein